MITVTKTFGSNGNALLVRIPKLGVKYYISKHGIRKLYILK